jgi:hypothetical protein
LQTESESPATRLIDELLESGTPVDDGQFTLDPAAAAAKLEAFTYADRSLYLIPIVEGLLGLGAREVVLETVGEDLLIRGRGIRLNAAQRCFTDIYSHAIGSGTDAISRALGRLAIGIDMILGGETCKHVRLCYSDPSGAVIGEYRFRAAPQVSRAQPDVLSELNILVDHPWPGGSGRTAALEHLRDAVRHSDREVSLDGASISGRPRDLIDTRRGEGPGYRFIAGFEHVGEHRSVIEFWTVGVLIESLSGNGKAFRAVIEFDAPRRDLSRFKIIRDETVEQALAAVEQARSLALRELEESDASWSDATRPDAWPPERVDRVLERPVRAPERPVAARATVLPSKAVAQVPLDVLQLVVNGVGYQVAGWFKLALAVAFVGWWVLWFAGLSIGLLFVAICLAVACLALLPTSVARQVIRARDHGVRTHATIVGVEEIPETPLGPRGRVRWSFTDHEGTQRTGRSLPRSWNEARLWEPGEIIAIYYNDERPDRSVWEADVGPRAGR